MLLDYPTRSDYDKFNARKANGLIPKNAKIGGGIGIHGTWNHDEIAVDLYQNWTNGCISLKREDVDELYDLVPGRHAGNNPALRSLDQIFPFGISSTTPGSSRVVVSPRF